MNPRSPRQKSRRQRAWRFGHVGETMAAWALRLKGYRVLATRFKTPVGEIDLICRRGKRLVFVEVKARRRQESDDLPVTRKQQRRIAHAALAFVQRNPALADHYMRFDLVLVRPWAWPTQIEDVWRAES